MPYTTLETPASVTLQPIAPATASVIWLHGLGADGFDFVPIVPELNLPSSLAVRFVFPHAAPRPVTINNGFVMRAWYDIAGLAANRVVEDQAGIRESQGVIERCIANELGTGIAADRIVIAGFSQGGAIALQTALRYPQRLAGVLALSTYLPLAQTLAGEAAAANRDLPILMCHGRADPVIALAFAEQSRDVLQGLGYPLEWRSYAMEHQVCTEELSDIAGWLEARLTRNI